MKILIIVLSQLPTLLCLVIAGYLAVKNLPGWGWFIFAALLVTRSVKFSEDTDSEAKPDRPAIERTA